MLYAAQLVTRVNKLLFDSVKWVIFLIAGLMLFEVISRYTFTAPTSWAPELATLLFGPFFLFGGPYLLHIGGHVAVDIVSAKAEGRTKLLLTALSMLLALVFGAILLRFSLPLAVSAFEYGETSYSGWNPVIWPAKAALPFAALLLILQALAELIVLFSGKETAQ
ncbi:TRAP transporter small permease subunit [Ahrensia kielensis]|uniref:TRAP transporter small permease subunit n=1 Tax=Ahrensia kielensis TaxID=76980 RepID=UPI000361BDEB|nr:TRAP transporter small permease [Ahrensia kielensis]